MTREELKIWKELGIPVAYGIRQKLDSNGNVVGYENYSISADEYEATLDDDDE